MERAFASRNFVRALLIPTVISLAACAEEAPKDYETDVVDQSGGKLIVEDENPDAVKVKLPDTPMTNVPPDEAPAAAK